MQFVKSAVSSCPFLSVVILAVLMWSTPLWGQENGHSEYEVKAAFIYNLVKFVEMPYDTAAKSTITIAVIGEDPFGDSLKRMQGKRIGAREINTINIDTVSNHRNCDILFISRSESGRLERITKSASRQGILTIGDTRGFAERGVMINFFIEHKKVRFEINVSEATRSGVKISAKVLQLGKVIK